MITVITPIEAWERGNQLLAMKRSLSHGEWGEWVQTNFDGSRRLAQQYMRLAKRYTADDIAQFHSINEAEQRQSAPTPKRYVLYRFWDEGGALLYVGRTVRLSQRLARHRHREWWQEVAAITLERHDTETALDTAEALAIRAESPRYNIRGVDQ